MNIVNCIVEKTISSGAVADTSKNRAIYTFAFENLLYSAISWGIFLIAGLVFKRFLGCVIFIAFYVPLRTHCGGFHQSSQRKCFVTSLFIFAATIVLSYTPVMQVPIYVFIGVSILSTIVVFLLAPQEDKNKPLSEREKHRYGLIARILVLVECGLTMAMKILHWDLIASFALFAVFTVISFLAAGKVKIRY